MKECNGVWITWEVQTRNLSMSNRLGAEYLPILIRGGRVKRYFFCIWKTILILFKNRKKIVFVQNPSIVLSFTAVFFKKIFRYKLVIDAHNSGVHPNKFLQPIANFVNANADFVIVTNASLADFISGIGGRPLILPDPLPVLNHCVDENSQWNELLQKSVMVICSWANDEPYIEIINSAKLTPDANFYITGNSKGREKEYGDDLPPNVVLTGFVSENDYKILLKNSLVILDLTNRENCLVCGAYEAISASKPLILSNTAALKEYFDNTATFVSNDAESISGGVLQVFGSYEAFLLDAKENSTLIEEKWQKMFLEFRKEIYGV
jgi:glycosyltransferase involved in cell wall biosynthesis